MLLSLLSLFPCWILCSRYQNKSLLRPFCSICWNKSSAFNGWRCLFWWLCTLSRLLLRSLSWNKVLDDLLVLCAALLFFYFANKNPLRLGLGVDVWFVVVSSLRNQVFCDRRDGTWLCGRSSKTNFRKSFWDGSPRHNPFSFSSNPPRTCGVSVPCCWTEPRAHIKKLRSIGFFLAKSCSIDKKQTTWIHSMGNESPSPPACCWYFPDAHFLKTSKRFMKKELLKRVHKEDIEEDLELDCMMEVDFRTYTLRSHGAKLARRHLHDWVVLLLLVVIDVVSIITPFYRFVGKDMMIDLKYPFKSNTVPIWSVPIYAVLLPIVIFVIRYLKRKDVHDLHHAILGILYAVLITGVITDAIKDAVGCPRPDFFWRCFPDGMDFYDQLGDVICTGDPSVIKEGHKSFPNSHTSWSFAGLGFLSLYLAAKIQAFDGRGHVGKLCLVFLPLLLAALVGVSRVDDYWHHWTDVFTGALIGLTITFFCYLQFFPPPYHSKGWGPYSYFKAAVEGESRKNGQNEVQSTEVSSPHLSLVRSGEFHSVTIG